MSKVTRIKFQGQYGIVRRSVSLFNTKPYGFYPDYVAGMPNRGSFIPISQAELDAAQAHDHS